MSNIEQNRILKVTRWLVYVIGVFVAVVGLALALASVILPFYWSDVLAKIAERHLKMDSTDLLPMLLAIFALLIVVLSMMWKLIVKLLAIISSVEKSDPFVPANVTRLKGIGWLMVAIQIVGVPLAVLAGKVQALFGDNSGGIEFPLNGILGILLVFILAGVFERGTQMRADLEGTV